jgi:DNA-binding response OmpR family regulator
MVLAWKIMNEKILIVEDEKKISRLVRLYLEESGFTVVEIHDGSQALSAFHYEQPDLVILDLNLPGKDGLDICRALRRESNVPIIMLTARTDETDLLIGLELGADDYVVKPFSPREVVARVRAVLRRAGGHLTEPDTLRVDDLKLDLLGYRAYLDNCQLSLTRSEFEILAALARNVGRVLSRQQLL